MFEIMDRGTKITGENLITYLEQLLKENEELAKKVEILETENESLLSENLDLDGRLNESKETIQKLKGEK